MRSGALVVIRFTYTNCPEACPLLTGYYLYLQERFAEAADRGDLAFVFITTDPEGDTPERLSDYTAGTGGRWHFLFGDLSIMERVWKTTASTGRSSNDCRASCSTTATRPTFSTAPVVAASSTPESGARIRSKQIS